MLEFLVGWLTTDILTTFFCASFFVLALLICDSEDAPEDANLD